MKIIMRFILLQALLAAAWGEEPPRHFTRERTYDVLHYKLNITVDELAKSCEGEVSVKLIPLRPQFSEIVLDAANMVIKSTRLGMKTVNFTHRNDSLFVGLDNSYGLDDTLTLTVSYAVTSPEKGMYFIEPDSGYPAKPIQVWTQGEAEDNHYWFPCYDSPNDMASSEMIVTVNDRFTAVSNGKLISVRKNPQSKKATFHWLEEHPHVSYLNSLIVGEYTEVKDTWKTVPLSYFVYPAQKEDAIRSFSKTPIAMEFFSNRFQYTYPWDKYAQTVVGDFFFGGEENVNATTLTDRTIHDSRAHLDFTSDALVAHELAHQWFGNLITCKDWSHAWLNEGFATYFSNQFIEYDLGKDAGSVEMMGQQEIIRNVDDGARRRPMVCDRYNQPMDLFDSRIYGKGAVVLSMLRDFIGDELFWKVIHRYVDTYAFKCVDTEDFENVIEDVTGYNLDWFFQQWVYGAGCPVFEVTTHWSQTDRQIEVSVSQRQQVDSLTGIFRTPLDIEVWIRGTPETYRVVIEKAEERFTFPAYQQPQCVIFDKGSKVLKRVKYEKPLEEWIFQLKNASEGVDRLQAIRELQWYPNSDTAVSALTRVAVEDRFSDVRQEAVWALGNVKRDTVINTLILAYGDLDSRVRTAAVASLGRFRGADVLSTLQHAFEKDSSYSVAAAALQSLTSVDSLHQVTYIEKALQVNSYNDIIRSAALRLLSRMHDDYAFDILTKHTTYGIDPNLRIQALNLLAAQWKERDDVMYMLLRLARDRSYSVRRSAIRALGDTGDSRVLKPLKQYAERESDKRVLKEIRETIEKIEKSRKDDE